MLYGYSFDMFLSGGFLVILGGSALGLSGGILLERFYAVLLGIPMGLFLLNKAGGWWLSCKDRK